MPRQEALSPEMLPSPSQGAFPTFRSYLRYLQATITTYDVAVNGDFWIVGPAQPLNNVHTHTSLSTIPPRAPSSESLV